MILRVYAMWNRSKRVLCVLLFIYVPQVILGIVIGVVYYNPDTYLSGMSQASHKPNQNLMHLQSSFPPVITVQVLDFTYCTALLSNTPWPQTVVYLCGVGPRFLLGVVLLVLAVIQTLKQSMEMYRATKQWQPNRYMQQLVKDGIFYFLVYVPLAPSVISAPIFWPILLMSTAEKLTTWVFFLCF